MEDEVDAMPTRITGWQLLRGLIKQAGPYLLIELLIPCGTLFAFMLFLARSGAFSALQPTPVACPLYVQCQVSQTPTRIVE